MPLSAADYPASAAAAATAIAAAAAAAAADKLEPVEDVVPASVRLSLVECRHVD